MALQTIKQLQQQEDYNFVQYSLLTNFINLPDGDYLLKSKFFKKTKSKSFYSKTVVHVRSNLIETKSLLIAAGEIRRQTKYHGVFLEIAQASENNNFIEVFFGS